MPSMCKATSLVYSNMYTYLHTSYIFFNVEVFIFPQKPIEVFFRGKRHIKQAVS